MVSFKSSLAPALLEQNLETICLIDTPKGTLHLDLNILKMGANLITFDLSSSFSIFYNIKKKKNLEDLWTNVL